MLFCVSFDNWKCEVSDWLFSIILGKCLFCLWCCIKKVSCIHLNTILRSSANVILFQSQLLQIIHHSCGKSSYKMISLINCFQKWVIKGWWSDRNVSPLVLYNKMPSRYFYYYYFLPYLYRSWDHHDILSVVPEYNSSNHCSTSARLRSIAPYSGRKETAVYATDAYSGTVIRCKVFIDNFSRIQIFHSSIKLDLDGLATLRVRAFDSEGISNTCIVGNVGTSAISIGFDYSLLL